MSKSALQFHIDAVKYSNSTTFAVGHCIAVTYLVTNRKKGVTYEDYVNAISPYGISLLNKEAFDAYLQQEYAY